MTNAIFHGDRVIFQKGKAPRIANIDDLPSQVEYEMYKAARKAQILVWKSCRRWH